MGNASYGRLTLGATGGIPSTPGRWETRDSTQVLIRVGNASGSHHSTRYSARLAALLELNSALHGQRGGLALHAERCSGVPVFLFQPSLIIPERLLVLQTAGRQMSQSVRHHRPANGSVLSCGQAIPAQEASRMIREPRRPVHHGRHAASAATSSTRQPSGAPGSLTVNRGGFVGRRYRTGGRSRRRQLLQLPPLERRHAGEGLWPERSRQVQ